MRADDVHVRVSITLVSTAAAATVCIERLHAVAEVENQATAQVGPTPAACNCTELARRWPWKQHFCPRIATTSEYARLVTLDDLFVSIISQSLHHACSRSRGGGERRTGLAEPSFLSSMGAW